MNATTYQYYLPAKAIKGDCPQCSPKRRKTLSRYVDRQTGTPLPGIYGRCDRENNCGYHLSPYHKDSTGKSYADTTRTAEPLPAIPKAWFQWAGKEKRRGIDRHDLIQALVQTEGASIEQAQRVAAFIFDQPGAPTTPPVCTIPDDIFRQSLGHYDRNQLARLLQQYFGQDIAESLLKRFQVGTSSYWPGACIFWYIDEQGRKRGGQIKLFDDTFHTVKYKDREGHQRSKTTWVHAAYARRLDQQKQPYPAWLKQYLDEKNQVQKSPCLFGLPQLATAEKDQPIAIVEAPKTAILCTVYFPDFIWMAVGALSYLNAERLAPLRGRPVMLFPDLSANGSAAARWTQVADELQRQGFQIQVSRLLEDNASEEARQQGLDIADYLLGYADYPLGYPPSWDMLTGGQSATLVPSPRRKEWSQLLAIPESDLNLYTFNPAA